MIDVRHLLLISSCFGREVCSLPPCACAETLAKAIKAEALEEAARFAEQYPVEDSSQVTAQSIAEGIRVLKEAPLDKTPSQDNVV
jgi:hypothetical protein